MKKLYLSSVGLAVLACVSLAGCGPYQLSSTEVSVAQNGARDYADREGGKFLSCSGQDSGGAVDLSFPYCGN